MVSTTPPNVALARREADDRQAVVRFRSDLAYSISTWLAPNVIAFDAYHEPSSRVTGFYQELRKESVKLL